MKLDAPRLTNASLRLEHSLDELDQMIVERDVIQKKLDRSWKRLGKTMKKLERRWDRADSSRFSKDYAKHVSLQKALAKSQIACTEARHGFHTARENYDTARSALSRRALDMAADTDHLHRTQAAMSRALGHVLERLKRQTGPQGSQQGYQVLEGAYDYIPYDVPAFLTLLVRLDELLADDPDYAHNDGRYRPVSLVEIGCGPGRNLLIARESNLVQWSDLVGFDINPDQVALGQCAFGLDRELHVADALTFDYSAFDVVFSFRPFSDNGMQAALEAHIAHSMRRNAYLLAPLSHDLSLCRELVPVPSAPDIWKKSR